MRRMLALSGLLLFIMGCVWAQKNEQALAEVAAGRLKEAKASWWGFNEEDATECLQAAIDSKVPKLIVDKVGKPWIVRPLKLVSNQEIVFEPGVEVLAKADEFKGTNDSLFTGRDIDNVTLIGYGATLRMRRADYDDPTRYKKAEWRHVLQFFSCRNIKVYGLTLAESGGDGIYLGTGSRGPNVDVHIKDCVCEKNYRQGISVINAENLLIENTILRDTAGTAPQAGIDFEPNRPTERIVNCVMRHCVAENNQSWGYVAYLPPLNATSAPVSLRLENCRAVNNKAGAFAFITGGTEAGAVKGTVELINCEFTSNGGPAFQLGGNPPPPIGCRLTVQGCIFRHNAVEQLTQAPIVFASSRNGDLDVGGVVFKDVLVSDPVPRPPMLFADMTGGIQVAEVTGNVIIEKDGQKQNVELTKELLSQWMPVLAMKKIPRLSLTEMSFAPRQALAPGQKIALPLWRLRKSGLACVWARQGEAVTVTLRGGQVGRYAMEPIGVHIASLADQEILKTQTPLAEESPVTFTAPATGLYLIRTEAGGNWAAFTSSSHPLNFCSVGEPSHFISSTGTLYFFVPAGTKEFGVRIYGEGLGEGVKAALINPAGAVVQEKDNITRAEMFAVELAQPAQGEIWSLKIDKPSGVAMEDYYVDLRGVPPLLAPAPECLLAPAP